MRLALDEAEAAAARGEVPVGAVIVRDGAILARAGNETLARDDPTAHAEMLVIRAAAAAGGSQRLAGADLYVTLEPCPMCAAAISFARIRRLYFGPAIRKAAPSSTACGCSASRPATTRRRSMAASANASRRSCSVVSFLLVERSVRPGADLSAAVEPRRRACSPAQFRQLLPRPMQRPASSLRPGHRPTRTSLRSGSSRGTRR